MREEANLLRSQQKASVWPYLDVTASFSLADPISLSYRVENKGVGPALIKKVRFLNNGEELSAADVSKLIVSVLEPLDSTSEEKRNIMTAMKDNIVLSSGEEMFLLRVEASGSKRNQKALATFFRSNTFSICYASIYGDHWEVEKGKTPIEVAECSGEPVFSTKKAKQRANGIR